MRERRGGGGGLALVALVAVSLSGCASSTKTGVERGKYDKQFKERVDQLAKAYESLDADRIAKFYAPDALTLTFHVPFKYDTGVDAGRVTAESILSGIQELKLHVEEQIEVWRWPRKVWTLRGFYFECRSKSGTTFTWAGRHSAIWEKQKGSWVIVNEHFLEVPQVGRPVPPPPPLIAALPAPEPLPQPILKGHLEDVFFDLNRWNIRADQHDRLLSDAEFLVLFPAIEVIVEGHCDERGAEMYNDRLGEKRAESVRAFLIENGVAPSRITTVSIGKKRPFELGSDETAWQQNRRAHFLVTKL